MPWEEIRKSLYFRYHLLTLKSQPTIFDCPSPEESITERERETETETERDRDGERETQTENEKMGKNYSS